MKNIICKRFDLDKLVRFHSVVLSEFDCRLFLDTGFDFDDGEDKNTVNICYDISNVEPLSRGYDGGRAPYLASNLLLGMEDAVEHYILPIHYSVSMDIGYMDKYGNIKFAYQPTGDQNTLEYNPSRDMRLKCSLLIKEIFGVRDKDEHREIDANVLTRELVIDTIDILEDETIGFETCKRRIEKLKEEPFYILNGRAPETVDLSEAMI